MGNVLNFLFDYYDYINNIEIMSIDDDLTIYKKFNEQRIVEGLIHTYPQDKSINIIKNKFNELNCSIEEDGEILIVGEFKELKNYIPLINNLGYFISKITYNGSDWIKEYDDLSKPIAIFLEAKYDIKIVNNPERMYHATHDKYKNRILKYGLIPKSYNKLSNHPERIYLTDDINIAKYFGISQYNKNYCICKIDMKHLDIKIYRDINLEDGGFYTLDNIPPNKIEII